MAQYLAGPESVERVEQVGAPEDQVRFWRAELALADKAERTWRETGRRVVELYRAESGQPYEVAPGWQARGRQRYQILWSNTEILKSATFSQLPKPDVSRRWENDEPVALLGAEVMERAISAHLDPNRPEYAAQCALEYARDDALLPGRGMVRVRYEAEISQIPVTPRIVPTGQIDEASGAPITDVAYAGPDGQPVMPDGQDEDGNPFIEQKTGEQVWIEHVYWEDVRFSPARCWYDVWWVAYRHVFTRAELVEKFGAEGEDIPLTLSSSSAVSPDTRTDTKRLATQPPTSMKQAVVWEIWSKRHNAVIWLPDGAQEILQKGPPPLAFEGFFDCPEPLTMVHTTDTMVPVPIYVEYQDLAEELNLVTTRISKLVRTIKAVGIYDATVKQLVQLSEAADGQLLPIDVMGALRDKGGLAGAITWWPIDVQSQALLVLLQHREKLKQEIFEITGLSDLIRGQTNPNETLGAQNLKAQFGTFRMTPMQLPMAKLVRDAMRLMGEVIAEQFDPQTLAQITGLPLQTRMDPQSGKPEPGIVDVMPLLRNERMRGYRLDVETDQLVRPDQQAQKQEAVEFTKAVTDYIVGVMPIAGQVPPFIPLFMEMLKSMVSQFRAGRMLEDTIDETADQLAAVAAQNQQMQAQMMAQQQAMAAQGMPPGGPGGPPGAAPQPGPPQPGGQVVPMPGRSA